MRKEDGNKFFYQWELNQRLIVTENCSIVQFSNGTLTDALGCEVKEGNGVQYVEVPNILLQTAADLHAYAWDEETTSVIGHSVFSVVPMPRPANYVYTETDVLTWESLYIRIKWYEGEGNDAFVAGALTRAITDNSVAMGANNVAGLRGYYWSQIMFNQDGLGGAVALANSANIPVTIPQEVDKISDILVDFDNPYAAGDVFSMVNGGQYGLCGTITEVDNNVIYFSCTTPYLGFPENSVGDTTTRVKQLEPASLAYDDYTFGVIEKADKGIAEIAKGSVAFGTDNLSTGICSFAEGKDDVAYGHYSHAEGRKNKAAYAAHAEGRENDASGWYSHAEGYKTKATNQQSHAEGRQTISSGQASHAEGGLTKSEGLYSHAEGYNTCANGVGSHAEGSNTIAARDGSHVEGTYNVEDIDKKFVHITGNGTSGSARSNAFAVDKDGHGYFKGDLYVKCANNSTGGTKIDVEKLNGIDLQVLQTQVDKLNGVEAGATAVGKKTSNNGEIFNVYSGDYANTAAGQFSHAEGGKTIALKHSCHAEGYCTQANGTQSHAEGFNTVAIASYSHVEGMGTLAKETAAYAHAEGHGTIATAEASHVEGRFNVEDTNKKFLHITGNGTSDTARSNAFAVDKNGHGYFKGDLYVNCEKNSTGGIKVDVEKLNSIDLQALQTQANKLNGVEAGATAVGKKTSNKGEIFNNYSGPNTNTATGVFSHAEGTTTRATGNSSHAEGEQTAASNFQSHAEGRYTSAGGQASHAEGSYTIASGFASHAEGMNTCASKGGAHAEGHQTIAEGAESHAEGSYTEAIGFQAHAEGYYAKAYAHYSHAEGYQTIASGNYSHVQGTWNIEDTSHKYAHIVGNGGPSNRSNAHTLDWQGNGVYAGAVSFTTGADYAEYFEWEDGNPNNEDRIGCVVALNGDKIKLATFEDDVLGIISGTAAVIGDTAEWNWVGRFLQDEFGRIITEEIEQFADNYKEVLNEETGETEIIIEKISIGFITMPKINPQYDSSQPYINRKDRPEWACVGMLGKLYVRDDGTCQVNGYAKVGSEGVLTNSDTKTNIRVISRTSEGVIRVLLK